MSLSPSMDQQPGNSAPERVAAFNREFAECLASLAEQRKYWLRTRDAAERKLEVLKGKLDSLLGEERDDLSALDEEGLAKYKNLRNMEREQQILFDTSRGMIDEIDTASSGDSFGGTPEDDAEGGPPEGEAKINLAFLESDHPRKGKGPEGGRFVKKGTISANQLGDTRKYEPRDRFANYPWSPNATDRDKERSRFVWAKLDQLRDHLRYVAPVQTGSSNGGDPGERLGGYTRIAQQSSGGHEGPRVLATYNPTKFFADTMTELGGAGTEFHEVSDPEFFHGLVKNAYDSHKFGKCVTVHEPQDYSGMRCFVAADHSAGFALRGDEIVSAFATGESRMNGHSILQLATDLGGRRLDCFDTVLPQLYGQMGFRAVSRIPFNEEYAPPGWNVKGEYDKYNDGKPDVVFMVYDPEAVEPYLPEHAKLLEDYDEAQAVQIKESEALKSKYHFERNIVNPVPLDASLQEKLKALKALTAENEAQIIQFTKEIDEATGAASKHSVKEDHKILAKSVRPSILNATPWHGVEHIRDALRFKTVVKSLDDIKKAVDVLKGHGVEIIKKDTGKLFHPKAWGWPIVAFDLRMPNGQLVEWYTPIEEVEEYKKAEGHDIYEKWREKNTDYITEHNREWREDEERMTKGYSDAFEAALARMGYPDRSAAEASWSKLSDAL